MTLRSSQRPRSGLSAQLLVVLIGGFIAVNAHWIWAYRMRRGLVLNIDEAGYFCYTMVDYYGLHYGGLQGWIAAVGVQSIQAPLTMAVASLLFSVTGPHLLVGFAVPLAAGCGCVGAAYALGARLALDRFALLGALLTACCPVIMGYTRSYMFATPAAFFAIMALLAMIASDNFRSLFWAALFGLCLGLMPLARTMTLAFIPGLLLGALLCVFAESSGRTSRFLKLCVGLLIAILVAGPWFWSNGRLVAQYLFNYGYQSHALEYGPKAPVLTLRGLALKTQFFIDSELHFPIFLMVLLGALTMIFVVSRAVIQDGFRLAAGRMATAPLLPVVIFNISAMLALVSSNNSGSGFLAPIIPPVMVQTGWAFSRLRGPCWIRQSILGLGVAAAIVTAVPMFAPGRLARPWRVTLPLIGDVVMTNGVGNLQHYEMEAGYATQNSELSGSDGMAWGRLNVATAALLTRQFGRQAGIMFAFRNVLYNVNTVNLQSLLSFHSAFAMQQIDPIQTGSSEAGYLAWLAQDGAAACGLLTSNERKGDFDPQVDPGLMQRAALQAGFVPVTLWPAPDGQQITLWRHRVSGPDCGVPDAGWK